MLDLRLLQCFVAIAEEGSFSRAAVRLGLVQSVVSVRLARLEDVLGLRLFARTSRRVTLTPQGEAFLPHANDLLDRERQAIDAARVIARAASEKLTVGAYHFLAEERQALVDDFVSTYPDIAIAIVYGTRPENLAWLQSGAIDLFMGLAFADEKFPELRLTNIGKRFGHIVVDEGHPLAGRTDVAMEDLRGMTIVLSPGRHDSEILRRIYQRFDQAGLTILSAPEADRRSIEHYARIMQAAHLAWLPTARSQRTKNRRALVPINNSDFVTDRIVFSRRDDRRLGLRAFLDLAGASKDMVR